MNHTAQLSEVKENKPAMSVDRDMQAQALLKLLGDDSPMVFEAVRDKIISLGSDTKIWLKPCLKNTDVLLRKRAEELIRHFDRESADARFLAFCLQPSAELDLERGAWLLAQTQYPHINVEAYSAVLDDFAGELRERLAQPISAHSALTRMNDYIFTQLGFTGNLANYYDPENSYLNRVLDRRTGNPISLCLIYQLLARRLFLPIYGIGLPGHSVCRYHSSTEEIYIDAFNLGRLMTREDCVNHLTRCNHELQAEYLAPMSTRRALGRMCGNLEQIYIDAKDETNAARMKRYLAALTR